MRKSLRRPLLSILQITVHCEFDQRGEDASCIQRLFARLNQDTKQSASRVNEITKRKKRIRKKINITHLEKTDNQVLHIDTVNPALAFWWPRSKQQKLTCQTSQLSFY